MKKVFRLLNIIISDIHVAFSSDLQETGGGDHENLSRRNFPGKVERGDRDRQCFQA